MKKFIISTIILACMSTMTYAQFTTPTETRPRVDPDRIFRPFKVGIGLGYAAPGAGDGAGGGLLIFLEPAYRATDQILVGLRLEGAFIVRGVEGVNNNNDVSGDANYNGSYSLNVQYYFTNENVRPFIGAGAGLFTLAAVEFNTANNNITTDDVSAETRFGFYPRIGVDVGHFMLSIDYNIVPRTTIPTGGEVVNNYIGIRAGISLGGGRIR